MGTRGAIGFRINDMDKVTYNHFDSYPEVLGNSVMLYIAETPIDRIKEIAEAIVLVDPDSTPSPKLIERYKRFADLGVSRHTHEEWYCLLRNAQGDLNAYNQGLEHMIDNRDFLHDSLFCEWAYIINLDAKRLEVYQGFNKNPSAPGRYSAGENRDSNDYRGVALLREVALEDIRKDRVEHLVKELQQEHE